MPENGTKRELFLKFNFIECVIITQWEGYHCWSSVKCGLDNSLKQMKTDIATSEIERRETECNLFT